MFKKYETQAQDQGWEVVYTTHSGVPSFRKDDKEFWPIITPDLKIKWMNSTQEFISFKRALKC